MTAARRLGIDVGGTFTDVLVVDDSGVLDSYKLPSAGAADFAEVFSVAGQQDGDEVCYSTTVALNALLRGLLPPVGFIVTAGFRELLETARLPDTAGTVSPAPLPRRLIALERVHEIDARIDAAGTEVRALDVEQVAAIARDFTAAGIDVVGVALLHSYLEPAHERALAAVFAEVAPHIEVVLSSTVLPEQSEYERALATALNASLLPLLGQHLDELQRHGPRQSLWVMQAQGGLAAAAAVRQTPVTTALSGPAAAVVGMHSLAAQAGYRDVVTLDVGGTSTDVALIADGRYGMTTHGSVAGFPLRTPLLDVLSIGAGGGSIAYAAADGRWHVGPDSAAAHPGPACYGRGGSVPTLTDAQLFLGRLPPALLGGSLPLDRACAERALTVLGRDRGFDAQTTARGILAIASHAMCGAIRRVCVRRGHDPAAQVLFAMGGAGPLHGAELADLLGMVTVVIPPQPGLAAAYGVLVADVSRDFVSPVGVVHDALESAVLARTLAELEAAGQAWLAVSGGDFEACVIEHKLDLRYAGMSHTMSVVCPRTDRQALIEATISRFHDEFERLAGRSWRDREQVEVVNARVTAHGCRERPALVQSPAAAHAEGRPRGLREVDFLGHRGAVESAVYSRAALAQGQCISGPAVIEQHESTTLVPPAWQATVDRCGNLVLARVAVHG
ncbi:MAG: hydantoinase/oxoprolinase family protein [Gammaproteobacteria bacterium]